MGKIQFWVHFIIHMPITCSLFILTAINFLIIFPLVFHFFVIPRIEKRIGQKLTYTMPTSHFLIISGDIVMQYFLLKVFNDPYKLKRKSEKQKMTYFGKATLDFTPYDIRTAPNYELIISFIVWLNNLIFIINAFSIVFLNFLGLYL